jgi:hypothetical protein
MRALLFGRSPDVGEPPIECGRAEARIPAANEHVLADLDAVIWRLRVRDDLTGVIVILKNLADGYV